jgi:hypothetical protein
MYACNTSYAGGIGRKTVASSWPQAKTQGPTQKMTKAKRDWSIVQVVGCLPNEHEALSLNPSTVNKNRRIRCKR